MFEAEISPEEALRKIKKTLAKEDSPGTTVKSVKRILEKALGPDFNLEEAWKDFEREIPGASRTAWDLFISRRREGGSLVVAGSILLARATEAKNLVLKGTVLKGLDLAVKYQSIEEAELRWCRFAGWRAGMGRLMGDRVAAIELEAKLLLSEDAS